MENQLLKKIFNAVKHWYLHLIIGIVLIVTGLWTFSRPVQSYFALTIIFSVSFLISGIAEIVFASSNRKVMENWGWTLALGILTTIIGILLIANPAVSALTLPLYIGFMLMFHAIWAIGSAIDIKSYGISGWVALLIIGILGVIFSFLVIWKPLIGGLTLIVWTGLALVSGGAFNVYLALKLRKVRRQWNKVSEATRTRLEEAQKLYLEELNG
ncbi:MAG: HdeD family acid-resistance protein [Lentimicrobium sp.]|jgi:uncharacterized membrane protein HdeD (DUF308 family)|nr:HdeD family acid-resistance protein [Lentimicrobium sp.]